MKTLISAAFFTASTLFAGAALAGTTQDQLAMCAAEIDDRGVVAASEYRAKFKSVRGGGLKKVTVLMTPTVDGKEPVEVICSIKRGEVVDVVVKS